MAAQSQQLQQDRQDEQDSPREPCKTPSTLPCMVFQHFPIEQYYRLLKPVAATAARAIEGYRNFAGRHFVLNEDKTQPGSYLGEGVSCPDADSGEFAILDEAGYFAISAGHDHRNAFVGSVPVGTDGDRQMMMVASPTVRIRHPPPVRAAHAAVGIRRAGGQTQRGQGLRLRHDQRIEARFGRHGPAPQADVVEQDVEQAGLAVSPVAVC